MFYKLARQPQSPKYKNPGATCGAVSARLKDSLRPWKPGFEISFYNSRNFYTDGKPWNFAPSVAGGWVEEGDDNYIKWENWMVLRKEKPRMVWAGWHKAWDSADGEVRAADLLIHEDDVYPSGRRKRGVLCFKTSKFDNAGELFLEGKLEGVAWAGNSMEVCFFDEPNEDDLEKIGWARLPDGTRVNTHEPLGAEACRYEIILPGHDVSRWEGVKDVVVKCSGREGCVPASFKISDPKKADNMVRGLGRLSKGCHVTVEQRWHWTNRWMAKWNGVALPILHTPPLKKSTAGVSLVTDRARDGKRVVLVQPEDIDFSKEFRPVVGTYYGKNGEERCLVSKSCHFMRQGSVAARERLVHLADGKGYRVICPTLKGSLVSKQKMYGKNALRRLPKNNPEEMDRLTSLYGDVVPSNYYDYTEDEIRQRAETRDRLQGEGFSDLDVVAKRSIVPDEVFRYLVANGATDEKKVYEGRFFYRPVTYADLARSPKIGKKIIQFAIANDMGWLCQLCVQHPRELKQALVETTFNAQ
jgi:hypothetical protein